MSQGRDYLQTNYRTMMIVLIMLFAIISVAWIWLAFWPAPPASPYMRYTEIYPLGATALCPGDILDYEIGVEVKQPGVFSIDVTTWRLESEEPVLISDNRRIVVSEPVTYEQHRQWVIPPTMRDVLTDGQTPWIPGRYERRHAISTTSRTTTPSIGVIPFEIRSDCNGR